MLTATEALAASAVLEAAEEAEEASAYVRH
jgi:hypothetical protein